VPGAPNFDHTSRAAWIDVDGDKRPDLVCSGDAVAPGIRWARNTTPIGASTLQFDPVKLLPGSEDYRSEVSFHHPIGERTGVFPILGHPRQFHTVGLSRL